MTDPYGPELTDSAIEPTPPTRTERRARRVRRATGRRRILSAGTAALAFSVGAGVAVAPADAITPLSLLSALAPLAGAPATSAASVSAAATKTATAKATTAKATAAAKAATATATTAKATATLKATTAAKTTTTARVAAAVKVASKATPTSAVRRLVGLPPSGGAWLSGVWTGGFASSSRTNAFGAWRGRAVDSAVAYQSYTSWQAMRDSEWNVTTFSKVPGRLSYGLALLPTDGSGSLAGVANGDQDDVWRKIASDLAKNGRGNAIVRIGFEANGWWFPWKADASNAGDYKRAFRHVAGVMKQTAPKLLIDFNLACGSGLRGSGDRLAPLTQLYPGDDVVDIVGCDNYDAWTTKAVNDGSWPSALAPADGAGMADIVKFARAHKKGFSVPEWGLTREADGGAGDNPLFMTKMRQFFEANKDVLVYESYFNEADTTLDSSIWDNVQNPQAAEAYRNLW